MRRPRRATPVTLSEEDGIRYLHFGTQWVQGGMRVARPFALELEYQRLMMALGLFLPQPRRIVQLGLGAAALTKFCWREVPSASVTAVELNVDVIDAARAWFCLPPWLRKNTDNRKIPQEGSCSILGYFAVTDPLSHST